MTTSDQGAGGAGTTARRTWPRIPDPFGIVAGFRARIEPVLPTRRAIFFLMLWISGAALALHMLTQAVTDDRAIHGRIVEGLEAGAVYTLTDRITADERFAECASLSILLRETGRTGFTSIMKAPSLVWDASGPSYCDLLRRAAGDETSVQWFDYGRYWHGNLTLHRLWLDRYDYASMTVATYWLALGALGLFLLALAWRVSPLAALATGAFGYVFSDIGWASFQPTQGISQAALFGCVALFLALPRRWRPETFALAAFGMGAAYNYFDFLYNPDLIAGLLGWCVVMTGIGSLAPKDLAWRAAGTGIMALCGYVAMWGAKWLIACLYMGVTFDLFFIISPFNVTHWVAGGTASAWPLEATWVLTSAAFGQTWAALTAMGAVTAVILLAWARGALRALWLIALPLGLTLLALEAASGHSISHGFTVRGIPWVIAAFIGGALLLAERGRRAVYAPAPSSAPAELAAVAAGD